MSLRVSVGKRLRREKWANAYESIDDGRISRDMTSKVQRDSLSVTINIIFRLLWSVILTFVSSLLLIVMYVYGTARTLNPDLFLEALKGLFLPIFLLFLFLTCGPYLLSIAQEVSRHRFRRRIRTRVERMSLGTRVLITHGCRLTTVCLLLISLITAMSVQITYFTDSVKSMIGQWLLPLYLVLMLSTFLSNFFITRMDWAVYNLERYMATHELDNLEKALKDYNRALRSTLSVKKLLAISQCVDEGLVIGNTEEKEDITRQLGVLAMNLRNKNLCDADRSLVDLSQLAEETVKEHKEWLGFEAKYPLRLRLADTMRSLLGNIFVQFMIVLIWIAVLMILSYFGLTKIIFPPWF